MRYRKSFSLTLFSQGIILCSGLLNGIIIARSIGTIGRGEYAMINFMVTILLVIMGEGIYRSNIYLTSRDKSETNINQIIANIYFYNALISFLFILLVILPNSVYQFFLPGIKPFYIYLGFGTALFFIFIRQLQGIFLGLQNFWHYNLINISPIFLFFLFNISILNLKGNLTTTIVLMNFLSSMGVTFLIAFGLFYRKQKMEFHFSWNNLKTNFSVSWRATVAYLLIFLLIRVNLYIVNYWKGLSEAGLFAVAINIAALIQQVPNVASVVLFPKVAQKETRDKLILTIKVAVVTLVISLLITFFFYFFGERFIIYLYTEDFAGSYFHLIWLLPGIILFSVAGIFNPLIWGKGFPPISYIGPLIPLIINIILCFILIPINGVIGAAQATTISLVLYCIIIGCYVFNKRSDLNI